MPPEVQHGSKKSLAFLKAIYGEHRVNIVAIDPHTEIVTGRTRSLDDPEIKSFLTQNYDKRNLYYSVNTAREGAPDGKLKKEHIGTIHAVWIDADPKPCPEGVDFETHFKQERKRLLKFARDLRDGSNPPTVITDSGGGIQAFWFLEHPVPAIPDIIAHYEGINRALAQKYDTDNVHNIDRIMRLPHTWNIPTKKKKGRKKSLARCTKVGSFYDKIDWIEPIITAEGDNDRIDYKQLDWSIVTGPFEGELYERFAAALKRNQKIDDLWTGKINMKPSRSERDFTLAKELKSEGFTLNETGCIMRNFPHGKGRELDRREIVRCYERSGVDFENTVDQETIDRIAKQVNPLRTEKEKYTIFEDEMPKRLRAVDLVTDTGRITGKPLIKKLIDKNSIVVMYGASNVGKSFVASDIAGHVAIGKNWGKYKTVEKMGVLYIAAEAAASYGKRGIALKRRLKVEKASLKEFPFQYVPQSANFLSEQQDLKDVVLLVKQQEARTGIKVGLIVVDTLATTFSGGNENSPEDMGKFISNMKWLQENAECAIFVVHHSGKNEAAGARGHSSLRAATDTEFEVLSTKYGERYYRQIKTRKQRDGQSDTVIKFGLQVMDLWKDDDGDMVTTCYVVLEDDDEFEFVSLRPEDELTGTKKAAFLTMQKFQEPDFLKFCKEMTKSEIRRLMIKRWFLTKNDPEKILSFEDLQQTNTNYHYDSESSNFSGDYREIRQYLDRKELSLDQWIKEFLVIPAQALSE